MWPFRRRAKSVEMVPPVTSDDYRWSILETTYDGDPLLIRLNATAKEWLGHPSLGIRLGFAVPLNAPNEGGLPTSEENRELNEVEDVILQEFEARTRGVYALALTTGVMREFVLYVGADADIAAIHEAIRQRVTTHEVQCMAVKDPAWDTYTQFAPD